jgi:hypothetical protein
MNHYYYVDHAGQQQGPVPAQNLRALGVTLDTLVWCDGMATWTKAAAVPELYNLFATPSTGTPPPPPMRPEQPYTPPRKKMGPCPDNYLVWSILATIFCCLPFGIVAIVNSSKVESLWMQGDKAGAYEKAESAKTWCWVSFGIGIGFMILYYLLVISNAAFIYGF